MKTLLTYATAIVIGLTLSTFALANGKGGKGSGGNHGSHATSYQASHGQPMNHGTQNHKPQLDSHKYGTMNKGKNFQNYHLTHGKKFSKGYYYPGKHHNHWSFCYFNKSYGCHVYCCPWTRCWYYYCVPDCCYYPVCYVPYKCYCWGTSVAYCSAPCPPADLEIDEVDEE